MCVTVKHHVGVMQYGGFQHFIVGVFCIQAVSVTKHYFHFANTDKIKNWRWVCAKEVAVAAYGIMRNVISLGKLVKLIYPVAEINKGITMPMLFHSDSKIVLVTMSIGKSNYCINIRTC